MNNKIEVFFNNRKIVLTNDTDNSDINLNTSCEFQYTIKKNKEIKTMIRFFEQNKNIKSLIIKSENIEKLTALFSENFKILYAGGGIVKNKENEILVIKRFNKWDLPKGHLKKEEAPETGAIREVMEECGINNLSIIRQLNNTYHTYKLKDKNILKITYWYEMSCPDKQKTTPQTEEGITEALWVTNEEINTIKNNTYTSLIPVFNQSHHHQSQNLDNM